MKKYIDTFLPWRRRPKAQAAQDSPATDKYLDANGLLRSKYWLDQPDALGALEQRVALGKIGAATAAQLSSFIRNGYTTLSLEGVVDGIDSIHEDIERAWRDMPHEVVIAPYRGNRTTLASLNDPRARMPGYRFADFHSFSEAAMRLMLAGPIAELVESIFEEPAIAFQSLYFEYGSQQGLHRDPMFVRTEPPSGLVAAWIALEDITTDAGPLAYVSGSHRLPYFEFTEGDVIIDRSKDSPNKRRAFQEHFERHASAAGLKRQTFTCKKWDVFVWHGSLMHGGSPVTDKSRTRKSFVVHYCPHSIKSTVRNSLVIDEGEGRSKKIVGETDEVVRAGSGRAFVAPLLRTCQAMAKPADRAGLLRDGWPNRNPELPDAVLELPQLPNPGQGDRIKS